jgi:Flp pilus assembly protein TadB
VFRRTKPEPPAEPERAPKPGGKGRPTPSRKEAEAARKASFKKPRNRREAAAIRREKVRAERAKMHEAMRTGDDRYLPAGDKGPVKRFARDYVDSRWSVMEFALPVLLLVSFAGIALSGAIPQVAVMVNLFFLFMILAIAFDWFRINRQLKKAVAERFPKESAKGVGFYAVRRTMQLRRWRLPKPMVDRGAKI